MFFKLIDQISWISAVVNYYIVSGIWISDIRQLIWNSRSKMKRRRLSLGQNTAFKKVTIKLCRWKDVNKICVEKKKPKGKNLTSFGINTPVYINDSLLAKCKKLHNNKLIYAFWTSNGSIKLKVSENGNIHVITHDVDLEELFPDNELIKDKQRV